MEAPKDATPKASVRRAQRLRVLEDAVVLQEEQGAVGALGVREPHGVREPDRASPHGGAEKTVMPRAPRPHAADSSTVHDDRCRSAPCI